MGEFSAHRSKSPHLLLVEDDETDVMFVRRRLQKLGYPIVLDVATDGEEALEIMLNAYGNDNNISYILLTDLNMDGMSGHQLIETVRQEESLKGTVIFVLSSSNLTADIQRAYEQNIAGYFTKQSVKTEDKHGLELVFEFCRTAKLPT